MVTLSLKYCGPIYSPWVSEEGFKFSKENVGLSGGIQTEFSFESQLGEQNRIKVISMSVEYLT